MDLSNLLMDVGETRNALNCLRRLVAMTPDDPAAWQNLAVALFARRRFVDGIDASHQCLRRSPRNISAMYNLAIALAKMKRYDDALARLDAALAIDPRNETLRNLEFRIRATRARYKIVHFFRRLLGRRKPH
jgi:superkiller protein 3